MRNSEYPQIVMSTVRWQRLLHSVLFGFWNKLASHLERSLLNHSYGYASASDRPTCFANLPQNSLEETTEEDRDILSALGIENLHRTRPKIRGVGVYT